MSPQRRHHTAIVGAVLGSCGTSTHQRECFVAHLSEGKRETSREICPKALIPALSLQASAEMILSASASGKTFIVVVRTFPFEATDKAHLVKISSLAASHGG